jgi:hypothetical protein
MNGRKAKLLRRIAVERSEHDARPGFIQRKVRYSSVDRHGKPVSKVRHTLQFCYHPMSWRPIYRRLKRAYRGGSPLQRALVGA